MIQIKRGTTRDHEPKRSMTETQCLRGTKQEYGPFFIQIIANENELRSTFLLIFLDDRPLRLASVVSNC
jgi:hypothetical protein